MPHIPPSMIAQHFHQTGDAGRVTEIGPGHYLLDFLPEGAACCMCGRRQRWVVTYARGHEAGTWNGYCDGCLARAGAQAPAVGRLRYELRQYPGQVSVD